MGGYKRTKADLERENKELRQQLATAPQAIAQAQRQALQLMPAVAEIITTLDKAKNSD